jgi:adenylate cyclase
MSSSDQHLIAILYADAKDYSRHMQSDEAGTIRKLKSLRACLDSAIASNNGRIANTAGDSVVAEFASVADAVNCAVIAQQTMSAVNGSRPAAERLYFRIGIHLADVVRNGADILGDGVNLAARIESVAEPGGISLSAPVYESVRNKLPYQFVQLDAQRLKNIPTPVTLYKVQLDTTPVSALPLKKPANYRVALYVGASTLLAASILYLAFRPVTGPTESTTTQPQADKPVASSPRLANSIAVLPLENFSPNPDDSYFAAGIHEEILDQLAKIGQLNVIARTTMRQYEHTSKSIPDIARELNVKTVMEGSIRYANNRVRVTTQLIDATTGTHLWSETYESEFTDIFKIESDIAKKVATALKAEFSNDEESRLIKPQTQSTEAYTLYLSARADLETFTSESVQVGADKINKSLALDPGFIQAWILKSEIYRRFPVFLPERTEEGRKGSEQAARRAVEIDPGSVAAHQELGAMLNELGRWQEAEAEFRKIPEALRRDNSNYAWLQFVTGQIQDSLPGSRKSLQTNPLGQENSAFYISLLDALGDYSGSVAAYQRGLPLFNNWAFGRYHLAGTLLGRRDIEGLADLLKADDTPLPKTLLALLKTPDTAVDNFRNLVASRKTNIGNDSAWLSYWAAYLDQPDILLNLQRPYLKQLPTGSYVFWRPLFAGFRKQPQFKTLVTENGLVAYWRKYGWPQFCQPVGANDFQCH